MLFRDEIEMTREKFDDLINFVKWIGCFSSSKETLEKICQDKDSSHQDEAHRALEARKLLDKIGYQYED